MSTRAMSVAIVVSAANGTRAGDGLDQHEPERVDVALAVDGFAPRLLGTRVAGGAEHGAGGSVHAASASARASPKSADAQPAFLAEQQVGRLDVAVDEAAPVRVVERAGRLEADHQRLRRAESRVRVSSMAAQAAAAEVLGDEVRLVVVLAPVVHRQHVRVVERRGRLRFGPEPSEERFVVGEAVVQDLDRDATAQTRVVGEEHQGRRTRTDRGDQPVPTAEHPTDLVGHPRDDHRSRVSPVRACAGEPRRLRARMTRTPS